jgi:NADH-quinone oxidoreductase subunit A
MIALFVLEAPRQVSPVPLLLGAESLHQEFATILVFLVFGAIFVVLNMVAIGRLIRSKTKYTEAKSTPYECGEPTFGSAFVRFDIRFYVLALVFVIFDVEVLFLFPWAAVMRRLGGIAWAEAAVFVAILGVGLAYVWRKGDIDWIPVHGVKALGEKSKPEASALDAAKERDKVGAEIR